MARPPKVGFDYFPHDTDAVNDPKIQALMALHGTAGYSFYFILLERVFRTENARLTIGKPAEKAGLAKTIGLSIKEFEAILETSLEVGCFILDENYLTSPGIKKRFQVVADLREKERKRKEEYKNKKENKKEIEIEIENRTRKTPGKPPENPKDLTPHPAFMKYASESFHKKFGEKLNIVGAKDGVIVKKLLASYEIEKLQHLWDAFLAADDPFIQRAGYSIGVFYSQINKLLTMNKEKVPKGYEGMMNWLKNKQSEGQ